MMCPSNHAHLKRKRLEYSWQHVLQRYEEPFCHSLHAPQWIHWKYHGSLTFVFTPCSFLADPGFMVLEYFTLYKRARVEHTNPIKRLWETENEYKMEMQFPFSQMGDLVFLVNVRRSEDLLVSSNNNRECEREGSIFWVSSFSCY